MAKRNPAQGPTQLPFQTPWNGFTPDLAVPAAGLTGLNGCAGLFVSSGVLTLAHGWARIASDTLPLGHSTINIGYTDPVGPIIYGRGSVADSPTFSQPIRRIINFQRFTAGAGLGEAQIVAITADRGGTAAFLETGHVFFLTSGAWTSAEYTSINGAGAAIGGLAPLSGKLNNWVDATVYPLGSTGGTVGGQTIQPIAESVLIFTNHVDNIMYFPSATGAATYASFESFAAQVAAVGGASTYYSTASSIFSTFKAKTLATFDGRVWYGNTVEGANSFGTRLRRSIVGNPFIVWPGFEIDNPATPLNLNGVGAGYIDLDQFKTPIQRVLPLGDVLCVYSNDGIAFIRRTGHTAAPYAIQYVTLDRGLISPGGVVPINPAQHFAILNDGWYLVSANGTLQELGITSSGTVLTGRTGEANYKWKNNFYSRLNQDALEAGFLEAGYDAREQFVRIAVSMGDGITYTDLANVEHATVNEVWVYDLKNDRVFPDGWTEVGEYNQSPTCWANTTAQVGEVITWAEVTFFDPTPWNSISDVGSWDSITPTFGGSVVTHGDLNGFVFGHDSELDTRDGNEVFWFFSTMPHNFKVPGAREKMVQRIDLQYMNAEEDTSATAAITVYGFSNDSGASTSAVSSESTTINLQRGAEGEMAQDYAHFKVTGNHHSIEMSGTGKIKIHSIDVELQPLEGRYRRREGS